MQTGLDHLGCFQVIAIDSDRLRYKPALVVGASINGHLESRYKHHIGHIVLAESKEPGVIFGFGVIGQNYGSVSIAGPHNQCVSGPGDNHSFDFVGGKGEYRSQKKQRHQAYYNRFAVHSSLSLFSC
jgi:hypothetical protein